MHTTTNATRGTSTPTPGPKPAFQRSGVWPHVVLFVALLIWFMRRAAAAGGAGGLMSFGRSRARRVEGSEEHVTFADVAGIDEAKEELSEIVDFLRNPEKYLRLGQYIE